jgi:Tfp pilus assembly protein PilO
MIKINFQNPIFIIIIISFLAVVFIGIYFLFPRFQDLSIKRKEVATQQQQIAEDEKYFLDLETIRNKLKEYPEQLSLIDSVLFDNMTLALLSLFNFLEITSAETGLILTEIGSFTIVPAAEGKTLKGVEFNFQVMGSYASFKSFLDKLERSAKIIMIENLSFSIPERGELFTFDLKVKTHSYEKPAVFLRKEIDINKLLEILRRPILKELELFPEIELRETGRENPFILPF